MQRWTAKRRTALVVSLLRGETTVQEAARKHALTVAEVQDWRDRGLLGAKNTLRSNPRDEQALYEEQIKRLKQKIGDLMLDLDIAKEALKLHPFPAIPFTNITLRDLQQIFEAPPDDEMIEVYDIAASHAQILLPFCTAPLCALLSCPPSE